MSKVIKRGATGEGGDISPDTGFADGGVVQKRASIIDKSTFEARSDAQTIKERALAEAEEIRRKAELEAEEIKRQAYELGYKEGQNEGAQKLSEIVAKVSQRLNQTEAQLVPQLTKLTVTIARKVLGRELEFAPEGVVDIVKQAISEKARQRRELMLRVNPDDLQAIRERKADLLEVLSRCKEIGIREDPDVARYGVIIETDAGIIDAQLDTQLEVFENLLKTAR